MKTTSLATEETRSIYNEKEYILKTLQVLWIEKTVRNDGQKEMRNIWVCCIVFWINAWNPNFQPPDYDDRNIVHLVERYGDAHILDSGWREVDSEEWFDD